VLLGMGADGHTASLFPGTGALKEERRWVTANRVDALDTDRITLTRPVLNNAADVIFMIKGADKAASLHAVLEGPYQPERFPAQLVRPRDGRLRWLVDPDAARLLPNPESDVAVSSAT
jgi:6-phosphogluconolactonase